MGLVAGYFLHDVEVVYSREEVTERECCDGLAGWWRSWISQFVDFWAMGTFCKALSSLVQTIRPRWLWPVASNRRGGCIVLTLWVRARRDIRRLLRMQMTEMEETINSQMAVKRKI